MRSRAIVILSALIGSVLLVGVPAVAQDTTPSISYGGVGFRFDPSLGTSVNVTDVPANPGGPFSFSQPAHLTFTLYSQKPEFGRVPLVGDGDVVVEFYRLGDMGNAAEYEQQLSQLQDLLSRRPNLKPYTVAHRQHADQPLPHVPLPEDAAQVLRARAGYVDTAQVSGIAYLTAYAQDVAGFSSHDFQDTFQGLSPDGKWLVSVVATLDASMFPKTPPSLSFPTSSEEVSYLNRTSRTLNAAAADAFAPSLTLIDQLVNSVTFEGMAVAPSPVESAFPSPPETPSAVATEPPVPSPTDAASASPAESDSP